MDFTNAKAEQNPILASSARTIPYAGRVIRKESEAIEVLYDFELEKRSGIHPKCCVRPICCPQYDAKRSYVMLRENSVEFNDAVTYKCCLQSEDDARVLYLDRIPFEGNACDNPCKDPVKICCDPCSCCCAGCHLLCTPCAFFVSRERSVEVHQTGCMCCCMKVKHPCSYVGKSEAIVVVKLGKFRGAPYCCLPNEVGWYDNCCGLCGPVDGDPFEFDDMSTAYGMPEVKNPFLFVEMCNNARGQGNVKPPIYNPAQSQQVPQQLLQVQQMGQQPQVLQPPPQVLQQPQAQQQPVQMLQQPQMQQQNLWQQQFSPQQQQGSTTPQQTSVPQMQMNGSVYQ